MHRHIPFTLTDVRIELGSDQPGATHLRVVDGVIDAIGGPEIARPSDEIVAGAGSTLLPGLIDAHVHLLPGCTALAARFGVTTVLDMFSKPDVIDAERMLGESTGQVCADLRSSGIGATAPGGHPSLAYAPFPTLTEPEQADAFVAARIAEGADHLKIIYDDGSGVLLDIPALAAETVTALVEAAHRRGLVAVAHVSTAAGAGLVVRAGVDVLAHVPHDAMSAELIAEVAAAGVAVVSTLSVLDGFPAADGVMPLLADPAADRVPPRWRRVVRRQGHRWMPPQAPDAVPARDNVAALHAAGVPILAGTDAPNPGLVHGISLHRELSALVAAGLSPAAAVAAATSVPARVFGLTDRGTLAVGTRADLVLVDGDPTRDIGATARSVAVWVGGQRVDPDAYPDSPIERAGITWLRETTDRIVRGIQDTWPGVPGPIDVVRADGELLGRVVPVAQGWQPVTTFGAPLGDTAEHDDAVAVVHERGLAALADPWWARHLEGEWGTATLMEVSPTRVRLRWADPMLDQSPSGTWYDLDELDLSRSR